MAEIKPFKAIRPPRDKAHLVASRSYISYSDQHLQDKLVGNPYTFIHVINPEHYLGMDTRITGTKRFPLVKQVFNDFVSRDILIKDEVPAFYLYRQSNDEFSFTGIIGGTSVQEYLDGKIKIHENTITQREQLFKTYLETCDFNAEPVLLTHKKHEDIQLIFQKYLGQRPEYEFCTTDEVKHELWIINDAVDIQLIQKAYSSLPSLYIADGHHRSASSAILGKEIRQKQGNPEEPLASDYYMACLIPENELKIFPFHRGIKKMPFSEETFLEALKKCGTLIPAPQLVEPKSRLEIGIQIGSKCYTLIVDDKQVDLTHPVKSLAPQILFDLVLEPILGIKDAKNDPNITYAGGPKALEDIVGKFKNKSLELAFSLAPISVEEVMKVADNGEVMPPKSTWVEPKLRSGMLVYNISKW